MGRNTSISLWAHFENFINSSMTSGKDNSASDVVRSALSLLESEEEKLKELRNALIEGENRQMVENFNSDRHLADLHQRFLWISEKAIFELEKIWLYTLSKWLREQTDRHHKLIIDEIQLIVINYRFRAYILLRNPKELLFGLTMTNPPIGYYVYTQRCLQA